MCQELLAALGVGLITTRGKENVLPLGKRLGIELLSTGRRTCVGMDAYLAEILSKARFKEVADRMWQGLSTALAGSDIVLELRRHVRRSTRGRLCL